MVRGLQRVLDIAFKREESVPVFGDTHQGRIRWDPDNDTLTVGTSSGWGIVPNSMVPPTLAYVSLVLQSYAAIAPPPTVVVNGATMGSTSAATLETGSSAQIGAIEIVTSGVGYGAGTWFTVTFASPLLAATYQVICVPKSNDALAIAPFRVTNRTVSGFDVAGTATPLVSKTYQFTYFIVGPYTP